MALPAPTSSTGTLADVRTDAPTLNDPVCDVCAHPVSGHDAIGLRFCDATLNGAISRGCICRSA
jgi:hypothetical protein